MLENRSVPARIRQTLNVESGLNDGLAVLDPATQERLLNRVLEQRKGRGVIWVLQRPHSCERFDRVLVMQDGRIVEQGSFADLNKPGSALSDILAAE